MGRTVYLYIGTENNRQICVENNAYDDVSASPDVCMVSSGTSTLRSGVLKICVEAGCRVVVNNTKPVDQLILSSSLEAGCGKGTVAVVHILFVGGAFGSAMFNSLCEVGGRPTTGYDNPHFREL
jgi:hypothetical protein